MGCAHGRPPPGPTLLGSKAGVRRAKPLRDNWEAELEKVGHDLKEKLKDPCFVAQRCDLDSSGDLDIQELKQAALCFGMKLSNDQLREWMKDRVRISKKDFARMVKRAPRGAERRAVPHSLRGLALGQLDLLERLFFASGWLTGQCESFNLQNAASIEAGQVFRQAANLYAMDRWIVTPMSKPGPSPAREQDSAKEVPEAFGKSSFSELLNPNGLWVHCFVSHFWGHLFIQTLEALRRWAQARFAGMALQPQSVVFWICLFALNQHAVADEVGEDPMHGPFNAALAQAEAGAVMVIDEQVNPFKRIWCLFEVYRLKEIQKPFEIICDKGPMSCCDGWSQASPSEKEALDRLVETASAALWEVRAVDAQASVQADRDRIWEAIVNQCTGSYVKMSENFLQNILPEIFEAGLEEFDDYMHSLLSSNLLELLCAQHKYSLAAKCVQFGARFTEVQLQEICQHMTIQERLPWFSEMLRASARHGHTKEVQLLLSAGAETGAASDNGTTALMAASRYGHGATVQVLLAGRADVEAAESGGDTPLIAAAAGGHLDIVKILLAQGADARVEGKNRSEFGKQTPVVAAAAGGHAQVVSHLLYRRTLGSDEGNWALNFAAAAGHEEVCRLLLAAGARLSEPHGQNPLEHAASAGHEKIVQLLLKSFANPEEVSFGGLTALMSAALNGQVATAKQLLAWSRPHISPGLTLLEVDEVARNGRSSFFAFDQVNVNSSTITGYTALMLAAGGGHESMTKLLLDNSADVKARSNSGVTALMLAAQGLTSKGPLISAARGYWRGGSKIEKFSADGNHLAVANLLLDHQADVSAAMESGCTALMAAAQGGHESMVKLLLLHRAQINVVDNKGNTALWWALKGEHQVVADLLLASIETPIKM